MKALKFHYITLLFMLIGTHFTFGQSYTFKVLPNQHVKNTKVYIDAIQKANMENYRYRTQPNTLQFNNGLKFVLTSAQELKENGRNINLLSYKNPDEILAESPNYQNPTFKLAENGNLIALYPPYSRSGNFEGK